MRPVDDGCLRKLSRGSNLPRIAGWEKESATKMAAYKRTQITVETHQVLTIRRRGCARCWCSECGRPADMVRFDEAALLTGVAQGSLCDFARTEKWHLTKGADGSPLICLDSLLATQRQAPAGQIDPQTEKDQ